MPPSLAREFFDSIVKSADPVAAIRALVSSTPPTFETDWLDFKTEHIDPKQRDKKNREIWCEVLSGFSNNQGGVLVWGVDARKKRTPAGEVDAACDERPIADPFALKSKLIEWRRQATDPPTTNVEVEAYEIPDKPGTGFVICFVPEGAFKPYRAEDSCKQYYLRASDNFTVMSRSVLQAMFYPRAKAAFQLEADLIWLNEERHSEGFTKVRLRVSVVNRGPATAKDTLVWLGDTNLRLTKEQEPRFTAGDGWQDGKEYFFRVAPFHPKMPPSEVFLYEWLTPTTQDDQWGYLVPKLKAPSVGLTVYAENQDPQRFRFVFSKADMTRFREGDRVTVEANDES